MKAMYDNQLTQLENLIATQRKAQYRMREQLAAVEKRYHKVRRFSRQGNKIGCEHLDLFVLSLLYNLCLKCQSIQNDIINDILCE